MPRGLPAGAASRAHVQVLAWGSGTSQAVATNSDLKLNEQRHAEKRILFLDCQAERRQAEQRAGSMRSVRQKSVQAERILFHEKRQAESVTGAPKSDLNHAPLDSRAAEEARLRLRRLLYCSPLFRSSGRSPGYRDEIQLRMVA